MKSYQRNYETYQMYLAQTKDLVINHDIKINFISDFNKRFANENSKAFKFTKYRLIAFLLDILITLAIVISLLATGITCAFWAPSSMSQNAITAITFCLAIIPTALTPLITWIIAQFFWLWIFKDFDQLKKIIINLVDHQAINLNKFSLFPCAIGFFMPTHSKSLPYKINYTSLSNSILFSEYHDLLLTCNNQVDHNELIKQICGGIQDVSSSPIQAALFGFLPKSKIRKGFSLTNYFYFCAAIYQNYLEYQIEVKP